MFLKLAPSRILSPLGALFLLFVFFLPSNPDLLHTQARAGIVFVCCLLAIRIGIRLRSWTVALALAYFLSHAALTFSALEKIPGWAELGAATSFAWLLSIAALVAFLGEGDRRRLLDALAVLCLVSSAILVGKKIAGVPTFFVMNNAAADACLIASLYPLVAFRLWTPRSRLGKPPRALNWASILLPVGGIAVSGSSTAFGAFVVALLAYAAQYRKQVRRKWKILGAAVMLVPIAALGLYFFSPDTPFGDSGRYAVWKNSYAFFARELPPEALEIFQKNIDPRVTVYLDRTGSKWTGLGAGSFRPLAEAVQVSQTPERTIIFPFAHNEPLQILFEQGWAGLLLALLVLLEAMLRSLDRPYLFAAVCTYAATMPFQFPLRYYGSAFVGALIFREAFAQSGTAWKNSEPYLLARGMLEALRYRAVVLLRRMLSFRNAIWDK